MISRLEDLLARPGLRHLPLVVGLLLCLPYLGAGLQMDDHGLRFMASAHLSPPWAYFDFSVGGSFGRDRGLELGYFPWWSQPDVRMAFFRPISSLSHAVDFALFPGAPALMHLHNLAWYAALLAAAVACYRRLLGRSGAAMLAALLFAVDDAHGEAASWIAGRNMLIAGTCGLLVLLLHDQ